MGHKNRNYSSSMLIMFGIHTLPVINIGNYDFRPKLNVIMESQKKLKNIKVERPSRQQDEPITNKINKWLKAGI